MRQCSHGRMNRLRRVETMKSTPFTSTVESAYGKTISVHTGGKLKEIKVTGTFDEIENYNELVSAGLVPSQSDIVSYVNAERKAAAKAKATTEALTAAGINKPDPNSAESIRERMISDAMKANPKLTREVATARVEAVLGGE